MMAQMLMLVHRCMLTVEVYGDPEVHPQPEDYWLVTPFPLLLSPNPTLHLLTCLIPSLLSLSFD